MPCIRLANDNPSHGVYFQLERNEAVTMQTTDFCLFVRLFWKNLRDCNAMNIEFVIILIGTIVFTDLNLTTYSCELKVCGC